MGHDLSKPENRLAVAAVSHITQFDRNDLFELRKLFKKKSIVEATLVDKNEGKNGDDATLKQPRPKKRVIANLSRSDFEAALLAINIYDSDREIFDRLFTMMDKTGDDLINYQEFLVGIAILVKGDIKAKLSLAFEIYDEENLGELITEDVGFVLLTLVTVASYFGDHPLTKKKVQIIVSDLARGKTIIGYVDKITTLLAHSEIRTFLKQEMKDEDDGDV